MSFAPRVVSEPSIVLPIGGREWMLPRLSQGCSRKHVEHENRRGEVTAGEAAQLFLSGGVYREMLEAGVSIEAIARALWVVLTDHKVGRQAAERAWRQGPPADSVRAFVDAVAEAKTNE
ncbi:hypothetical protein [Arthrobacter sp. Y-9]|uniref:DUF7426 family protein n=1 Tax=Arthrobacter sp. Y-9 TaxID=3039385 RepID=UPI00241E775A|nr:hypothetical protein [Arthrobacter sp. Y-9]WFR84660.1 hypothetical protein P9849_03195 [Arthrobacter sp. Y-9]